MSAMPPHSRSLPSRPQEIKGKYTPTQGKEPPPCTTLDLGHPQTSDICDGGSAQDQVPGSWWVLSISQPFLGQIGSKFGSINYMYGIFSGEVGRGIWKLLLKLWRENI